MSYKSSPEQQGAESEFGFLDDEESFTDTVYTTIARAFYPFYTIIFNNRQEFVKQVEQRLIKANRAETVEVYLSAYLGMGVLSGGLTGLFYGLLLVPRYTNTQFLSELFPPSPVYQILWAVPILLEALLFVVLLVGGGIIVGGLAALLIATIVPRQTVKNRRAEINILLPDAIAFMYCLSAGGMSRVDVIRVLATSEETYGEVSVEFQRIIHYMDSFSEDFHTAISEVAETTPSENLREFLNDTLSVITSGGRMDSFLESQFNSYMSNVEQTQQQELDRLELINELYITMTLVPVMGLVLVAFAAALGVVSAGPLLFIAYGVVPAMQVAALIIISTIFQPAYGSGRLTPDESDSFSSVDDKSRRVLSAGIAEDFRGQSKIFDQIYVSELRSRILSFLADPFVYARKQPEYILTVTAPVAIIFVIASFITGNISFEIAFITENALRFTLLTVYIPALLLLLPYVYFYETEVFRKGRITDGFTNALNKLANTNEQGIPLRKSMLITSEGHTSLLATEFETMYKKQEFGVPLGKSIIETNNKYQIPRLARLFRIIKSAQDISNNINDVLKTASSLSETQDKLVTERKSRTRQQISIIVLIFFIFVASLVLMEGFIIEGVAGGQSVDEAGLGVLGGGNPVDGDIISLLFFHGALVQGGLSGLVCGYIRSGSVIPGIKYSLAFMTISMGVWVFI